MLPTEDLFVHVYVLIDDAITTGAINIPTRPGPAPACTDAELLTIALVRHLLGRRSEAGFLAEVVRDWAHLFPRLPHQSEVNRRVRWLWAAFEQLRDALVADVDVDDCQQFDTSALPVKHTSRVRGPDSWVGPAGLMAGFGRDAAHAEWFYGFRLAIKADLGTRLIRAWSIVPAAVNERDVAIDLLETGPPPRDLLADKGLNGKPFAAACAARGTAVLIPPTKAERARMPSTLQKVIACWRNYIEVTFGEVTDRMELARHGAHTFWGLLTRTAATLAAHTLLRVGLLVAQINPHNAPERPSQRLSGVPSSSWTAQPLSRDLSNCLPCSTPLRRLTDGFNAWLRLALAGPSTAPTPEAAASRSGVGLRGAR